MQNTFYLNLCREQNDKIWFLINSGEQVRLLSHSLYSKQDLDSKFRQLGLSHDEKFAEQTLSVPSELELLHPKESYILPAIFYITFLNISIPIKRCFTDEFNLNCGVIKLYTQNTGEMNGNIGPGSE